MLKEPVFGCGSHKDHVGNEIKDASQPGYTVTIDCLSGSVWYVQ